MNEDRLHSQLTAGMAADQALATVGDAFAEVKQQLTEAWLGTKAMDQAGREKLFLATTLLSRVETVLRNRVSNGKIAEAELEALRKTNEPKKLFGFPVPI